MTFLSLAPHPWILLHHFPAQSDSGCKLAAFKCLCLMQWNLPARCKTQPWPHTALSKVLGTPVTLGQDTCPCPHTADCCAIATGTDHWKRIRKGSQRLLHHHQVITDQTFWGKGFFWLPCFPSTSSLSKKMLIAWAFLSLLVKHCHQPAQIPFAHSHAKKYQQSSQVTC